MAESRLLPCNFYSWPSVLSLELIQRHTAVYVWINRSTNSCGCYLFPVAAAAAELGLGLDEMKKIIKALITVSLVDFDWKTSEIVVRRWCAFHKFNTPAAKSMFWRDVNRIESVRLKKVVLDGAFVEKNDDFKSVVKSKTCRPTQSNKTQIKSNAQTRAREPDSRDDHWKTIAEAVYLQRHKRSLGGGAG